MLNVEGRRGAANNIQGTLWPTWRERKVEGKTEDLLSPISRLAEVQIKKEELLNFAFLLLTFPQLQPRNRKIKNRIGIGIPSNQSKMYPAAPASLIFCFRFK